jgi:hypothetical protein
VIKRPIIAVAISALALYGSTGFGVVWPLAWVAPIPVLLLALRSSWRVCALAAFSASFLGSLTLASAYGPGGALIFGGPPAIVFAAAWSR